ncbi:hypothetical protein, variant 1 [Phytophthora nicotianae CJ01A1]|uniref:BHLH domain-containing protein n=4 Tax=Phytophthora nicotianae TaxID=4792 RepID=W2YF87_PHYNI|nr:hypothetical protein L915_17496 [Phytophthora nicotianae]ETP05557.1 hypothetical protein F441_17847 [Phytophthora nicotianae CJ01A1]ETP33689.1 hypothetical protein F442_17821 [Phytophthora nicotianae P10297]ETK75984.1 hypothetical protein, variant 1 [Phytophthora nicotianae]ETL29431.1 hypothetical protein L916_17389 [Phytophthora nicotianae]
MDFDEDMSGLQIEDLGEYFLQTDINDNWKGFSLGYTDEEQQNPKQTGAPPAENTGTSTQHLTSPPLASISEMLKHGNGLGVGLGFGSPRKDFANLFQTGLTPASAKPDVAMMNRTARDAIELANFSLDQHRKPAALPIAASSATKAAPLGGSIKPAAPKVPSPQCQNILSNDDDDMNSFGAAAAFKRDFDFMTVACDPSGCSTIGSTATVSAPSPTPEDDRGYRKKSREKMRRQEVNVKFEELVDLLGLSNRVRKSAILQEAVSAIKSLKRERDELRRDRDRLQQEVSKLATCLQYSHLGSVAAAMTQPNQHMNPSGQLLNPHDPQAAVSSGMQAVHTHPLNVPCNPGTNCFPISSAFSSISSQLGSHSSSSSSGSGQVAIAPKNLKPAPFTPIAPDTEMK